MTDDDVWLPPQALARWRSADEAMRSPAVVGASERWCRWIDALVARMRCSGGRLGEQLVRLGLCEVEQLVACLLAQLDAGPLDDALSYDVEADLYVARDLASLEQLERISAQLDQSPWASRLSAADDLHVELARRLHELGRSEAMLRVLERVRWHGSLVRGLEELAGRLAPDLREQLVSRAWRMVEACWLPPVYHVGWFTRLAVLSRDLERLEQARGVALGLAPELLEVTPDYAHPLEDIAWGLARLGRFDEAKALIDTLAPEQRWSGLIRLLPEAPSSEARSRLVEEAVGLVEPLEQSDRPPAAVLCWESIIEAAPETAAWALDRISTIADDAARFEELAAVAGLLRGEQARGACAELLALRRGFVHEVGTREWERAWERSLDALTGAGCEALLDAASRRELVQALLEHPQVDLWGEVGALIPDDLASAVLEHSRVQLELAKHYMDRERWIALGRRLLDRVAPTQADAWRESAAVAAVWISFDRAAATDTLAIFSADDQRRIVLARLANHQREFLPTQLLRGWLATLGWQLPSTIWRRAAEALAGVLDANLLARQLEREDHYVVEVTDEPTERARCLAGFEQLLAQPGWPDRARVSWALALLGRVDGEEAVVAAIEALIV